MLLGCTPQTPVVGNIASYHRPLINYHMMARIPVVLRVEASGLA